MGGIVGAIAARDVSSILVDGLHRLEYRGYDSTGVAMLDSHGTLQLRRAVGKVVKLEEKLRESPCHGQLGIAHSRWAKHGGVTEANAHPHVSGGRLALIHNGHIEHSRSEESRLGKEGER